jgi:signal transduction histidine kinase
VAASNYGNRNFTSVEIKGSDEITQLSESFNNMGIQLQEYIQRQKQFVANMSHELRTPLTAIKGYSEYLKDEVKDRPDLQKAVYHLNNESKRLTKLVEEVLTLSRIDSSSESFNYLRLNFSELIHETVEKMQLRAEKYRIKINSKLEPDIYILGDNEKLIQVIINLLDNAFKFSSVESKVEIILCKEGNMASLSITDEGIGIPKEASEKVFERFYRAQNAEGVPGTGLGLSIVKHIIDTHKGSIELTSGAERGTIVELKLPIKL